LASTYRVVFRKKAKKRFDKLDFAIQRQVARKLSERCGNPRVQPDALSGMPGCYKVKLRARGIRLVYMVRDSQLILLLLAVGSREGEEVYSEAMAELAKIDD
jgi:mRNA interferase RelE/StbE